MVISDVALMESLELSFLGENWGLKGLSGDPFEFTIEGLDSWVWGLGNDRFG